jgi:pimeloyl-ACP methyl ester carboxylesterase
MTHLIKIIRFMLLLLALLLSACSLLSKGEPPKEPSLNSAAGQSIQLKPCQLGGTQAQCGTLKVYENRAAHSGRMIALRVVVIKAESDHPAPDPIFYLAGGPGEAAAEVAARGQQFPFALSENHDLVYVDQRGTGGSNRVLVPQNPPDVSGLPPEEMDTRLQQWVSEYLEEIDMDPRFYTTSLAMDDLDDVRAALGYDKINLTGFSYGATAAQYYLRQHEEHVRSVVLYGGSLLDIPVFERWALNGQRSLDRIFDLCQADPSCQTAFPNLRAEFSGLLERLAAQPVTETFTRSGSSQSESVTFTSDIFAAMVRMMTKDAKNVPVLPLLIHRAYQENDWKGFTLYFAREGGYEWWGPLIMERVIRCGEKWASFDPQAVERLSEGSYLKDWDVSLAQNQALSCQLTPRGEMPEGMAPQPGSQVPVLVINSDMDPIDPPDNMAGAKTLWPNSLSLVLPYRGHSLSDSESVMCLWSLENQFIQAGSVNGLNTDCLKSIRPPTFILPANQVMPTPTTVSSENTKPAFKTSIGELAIEAVRWVDEVNGARPGPDERIMLISLNIPYQEGLYQSNFSLENFDRALRDQTDGEVHILGDDGSYTTCTMAGWVGEKQAAFAIGFRIPNTARTFQFYWPGNEPIDLKPEN